MKKLYSAYTLLIISWPVENLWDMLTPTMIKFIVLGVVVPPIAIWMLFNDENSKNPTISEAVTTFFTSLIFVWLGYEASIETKIPVVLGLVGTFFLGLSSLPVIMKTKKNVVALVAGIIDSIGDWAKKFINK